MYVVCINIIYAQILPRVDRACKRQIYVRNILSSNVVDEVPTGLFSIHQVNFSVTAIVGE